MRTYLAIFALLSAYVVVEAIDPNQSQLDRKYAQDHPIRRIQKHSRNLPDLVEYLPGYRFSHLRYEMGSGVYSEVRSQIINQYDYRYFNNNRINYYPGTWGIEPGKKSGVHLQREPYPKRPYQLEIQPNRNLKLRQSPFLF